jgi:hypothetical protein
MNNQELIHAARLTLHKAKVAAARERKKEKNALERMTAEIRLLMDDCKAEGVDTDTPEGKQILAMVMGQMLAQKVAKSSDKDFDLEDWPEGM